MCWCGGEVGPREPGDANGLGCLENIHHVWAFQQTPLFNFTEDRCGYGGCELPEGSCPSCQGIV
jgi:hypothetical protein